MCRRNHLHGWCLVCLGVGLLLGHSLESWLVCCLGGIALICLGFCVMKQK